jgi:hypothetical protein
LGTQPKSPTTNKISTVSDLSSPKYLSDKLNSADKKSFHSEEMDFADVPKEEKERKVDEM